MARCRRGHLHGHIATIRSIGRRSRLGARARHQHKAAAQRPVPLEEEWLADAQDVAATGTQATRWQPRAKLLTSRGTTVLGMMSEKQRRVAELLPRAGQFEQPGLLPSEPVRRRQGRAGGKKRKRGRPPAAPPARKDAEQSLAGGRGRLSGAALAEKLGKGVASHKPRRGVATDGKHLNRQVAL